MRHQYVRFLSARYALRPSDDRRHHRATLEGAVLVAAVRTCGAVTVEQFLGLVIIAVVKHRAVVAGEYHKSVVGYSELVKSAHDLAHRPVKLRYGVAPDTHRVLASEALVGETGHMHVVGAEIHEERFAGIAANEVYGVRCDRVGYVLVLPQRLAAARHVAYAAYAVDYGHVVAVRRPHVVEQLRIVLAGRLAGNVPAVIHAYRMLRIVVGDLAVFDEYAWHTVGRGCHDIVVVKSYVGQTRGKGSVPVLFSRLVTESEMPFAYGGGAVAGVAKHVGHRVHLRAYYHSGIARGYICPRTTPGIFTRQKRIPRGGACGGYGMGVGELDALVGKSVDVGGADIFRSVAFEVAVTEVVGQNDDYIGLFPAVDLVRQGIFLRFGADGAGHAQYWSKQRGGCGHAAVE